MPGKGNGNGRDVEYYQSSTKPPPKPFIEKRLMRVPLTEEQQNLLQALDGRIKNSCRDTCFLTPNAQSVVNHGIGALGEIGDDKQPGDGVDKMRDQHKRVKGAFKIWDTVKMKVLITVVITIVAGAIALFVAGFWTKVQGG